MNVLAVGAHPDDVEIGCGGSLYLHSQKGDRVHLLVVTDGNRVNDAVNRIDEQKKASKLLGAVDCCVWHTPDFGYATQGVVLFNMMHEVMLKVKPDVVYTHYVDDTHQEHRAVAQTSLAVGRLGCVKTLLMYESVSSISFNPNWYQDISGYARSVKHNALDCHDSQVSRWRRGEQTLLEVVRAMTVFRGSQIGVDDAEGFVLYRHIT